ncbi:dicarboxylate/amino acid:cation symporter [Photobacterium gaetbulicola]|uniref:Na(+)/H(+)-dicarboxylate symporter n=1 Tax=Photobacterium gaetbulicola Gung47 TaxID=658445 RepID=A0A0C5W478_9GAMM|nr:dicarboxylate/amino acid:cation symporter [Photobacterium gaetbulicola]AJR06226.1 Na(+)/H(+)-dicarboxylate symporter [Photobacterium gaetbulicola Gung47]PSU08826.1 dicarboxylate/amino acid:cation symporter [Photobacterium gaetbulicola]
MNLIIKLLCGIFVGILMGMFAPEVMVQALITAKYLVSQLIKFTIPLLILFYVTSGIASLPKNSGKLLSKTVGLAYISTLGAGILAFMVAKSLFPALLSGAGQLPEAETVLSPFLELQIPPIMNIMTALTVAFIFGLGISNTGAENLKKISDQGRDIIELFLNKVMIPALPFYIAGVFADMTVKGTVFATLQTFSLVLLAVVAMHWFWLSFQFVTTGVALQRSPLKILRTMLPAYFTAVGTMSSAATVPVTLQQTKRNGVSNSIANFVVPLCANIHMSGSVISIASVAVAVIIMTGAGQVPSLLEALPFLAMLGITMVAAPGAPGGAVMASAGLLGSMLGFTEEMIALQIVLHLAQDSFGTACNVTGDGVIALLIDKVSDSVEESGGELVPAEEIA